METITIVDDNTIISQNTPITLELIKSNKMLQEHTIKPKNIALDFLKTIEDIPELKTEYKQLGSIPYTLSNIFKEELLVLLRQKFEGFKVSNEEFNKYIFMVHRNIVDEFIKLTNNK